MTRESGPHIVLGLLFDTFQEIICFRRVPHILEKLCVVQVQVFLAFMEHYIFPILCLVHDRNVINASSQFVLHLFTATCCTVACITGSSLRVSLTIHTLAPLDVKQRCTREVAGENLLNV